MRLAWTVCVSRAFCDARDDTVENGDGRAGDGIDVFAVVRTRGAT